MLHGARSFVLQDEDGQIALTHSVCAGLDYPGRGTRARLYKDCGRASTSRWIDRGALDGFETLAHAEGIIPALESAHARGVCVRAGDAQRDPAKILVNLSGRGDKDVVQAQELLGEPRANP